VTDAIHVVTHDAALRNGSEFSWSPSGHFLALTAQRGMLMLNLDSGEVFDATPVLELHKDRYIDWLGAEWSPDGARASFTVSNAMNPPPSEIEKDLLLFDPEASSIRYVASWPWTGKGVYGWETAGDGYDLVASAEPPIFRKRRYQIPDGISY
jgi:Tol biopolymer transport system component